MTVVPRALWAALLALGLTACGFHLRGTPADTTLRPLPFQSVYVVPGAALVAQIDRQLKFQPNLARVSTPQAAQAVLRVTNEQQLKETATLNRAGQISEYRLIYRATVTVTQNGRQLGEPITVSTSQNFPYSESSVLGKAEEELTVWKALREGAAQLLMYRLAALKPADDKTPPATAPASAD
ncbi:LPS-assembly lipoprotein LptE [Laribacter hongkongensis]|uniref:LPS-assembly lipoprotein LptE n=1 Tax=Laribacter hongkongensis TaxID=168471 RepID=UPI001EFC30D2|nr:LPS assembly lipoprotein LptE [Laribacter hongkongensis]MCG9081180.1 LPS assembly lipoprotein LptE [Laribacter hongkongensis]